MAAEAVVPMFFTVAVSVTGLDSVASAGPVTPVTVRSGLGAAAPNTWSSATCPLPAPVFPVKTRRTSVAVPLTGTVTELPVDGLKDRPADGASVVNAPVPVRPCTSNVCVRLPHAPSGLSLTVTAESWLADASVTVRLLGYWPPAPSQ